MVVLSGNEIGILLAEHILTRDPAEAGDHERLVITTLVSSRQLERMAVAQGVRYAETLTGIKWIANAAIAREERGQRFVFGYEEALGYTAGDVTRDKDGIGAAVVFAELAALERKAGRTVLDRLRDIRLRYGLHVSRQKAITFPALEARSKIDAAMSAIRRAAPRQLGPARVEAMWDLEARLRTWFSGSGSSLGAPAVPERREATELPPSEGVIFDLEGGGRVAVRPSGTEPKIKLYFEVVETLGPSEIVEQASARGQARIDALLTAVAFAAGLAV
jgi:phosphomannomutase